MQQFQLFPRKQNLATGALIGVGLLVIARIMVAQALDPTTDMVALPASLAIVAALAGGSKIVGAVYSWVTGQPVFIADAEGFQVMGGRVQPWSNLGGVRVRQLMIGGVVPVGPEWVSIELRKGLVRRLDIPFMHLPGGAGETTAAVLRQANLAWRNRVQPVPEGPYGAPATHAEASAARVGEGKRTAAVFHRARR